MDDWGDEEAGEPEAWRATVATQGDLHSIGERVKALEGRVRDFERDRLKWSRYNQRTAELALSIAYQGAIIGAVFFVAYYAERHDWGRLWGALAIGVVCWAIWFLSRDIFPKRPD